MIEILFPTGSFMKSALSKNIPKLCPVFAPPVAQDLHLIAQAEMLDAQFM